MSRTHLETPISQETASSHMAMLRYLSHRNPNYLSATTKPTRSAEIMSMARVYTKGLVYLPANHWINQAYTVLVPPTKRLDDMLPGARDEMESSPSSGRSLHP